MTGRIVLGASVPVLALLLGSCAPSPRVHTEGVLPGPWRVAVLPLTNFTATRDAVDRVQPMVLVELSQRPGVSVVDMGRVEEALADEPWIQTDRLPPDLVDSLGTKLDVEGLVVGSVLAYGMRDGNVPQVSLSLRLLQVPGGRVIWTAVHSRDGEDRESVFGFGRVDGLQNLAEETVKEAVSTFPKVVPGPSAAPTNAAPPDSEEVRSP
jgi:hypothetical protein